MGCVILLLSWAAAGLSPWRATREGGGAYSGLQRHVACPLGAVDGNG